MVNFGTLMYICVMYEKKIPLSLNCGLDLIGEVLYGKWKMRLLWFINEGHKRPSELQRKIPDASRRVLNIQLKELEGHELITKVIYPVVPPKVEYSLTEFGKTLIPVISAIGQWGDKHDERLRNVILKQTANSNINDTSN
ncbi:winged helix-turn-helix transcriptional regulator [Elizabethkingia miricola]|uniref:Winged helix-turn-helix transcriptional regulator n=2 Tax=Elizabethkingia TaxID=308865 RepID=A0ABD5B9I6_ELIMR|nr:winged helix-turn-helix transcriptional regulator [Elizabethkingia miricola]MDQ8750076.1 winged helix-turn-helix transcriptional regulator [Elizabethkingia miricola]